MPKHGQTIKKMVDIGKSQDDCWLWLGTKNKNTGYGKKTVCGKSVLAHRWMWEQLFGSIPEGKVINHKCCNVACVNPHHLEVVTQAENVRFGKTAKLNEGQAKEIYLKKRNRSWGDGSRLAKKYGVSGALIHDIWNGRAWQDVTGHHFNA